MKMASGAVERVLASPGIGFSLGAVPAVAMVAAAVLSPGASVSPVRKPLAWGSSAAPPGSLGS